MKALKMKQSPAFAGITTGIALVAAMVSLSFLLASTGKGGPCVPPIGILFFPVIGVISLIASILLYVKGNKTMKIAGLTFLAGTVIFWIAILCFIFF